MSLTAIRTHARQVYVPTVLVRLSEGMLAATLPLYLLDNGLSASRSSIVLASVGFGSLVAAIPMGMLLARHKVRDVLRWVGAIAALALVAVGAVPVTLAALVPLRMIAGLTQLSWLKGQETYLFRRLDPITRGTSMAGLAATNRTAYLVGPIVGGAAARLWSYEAAFALAAASTVLGVVLLLVAPVVPAVRMGFETMDRPVKMRAVAAAHLRPLVLVGVGQLCVGAVRLGYVTLVAFQGSAVGLSTTEVGLVLSLTFLIDLALFPVAGRIMDVHGRLHAIVPSFLLLSIATALVSVPTSLAGMLVVAVLAGTGNGLSNGTLFTLNSDLAPPEAPGQFLAMVGFLAAAGDLVGPLLVGTVTDAFSLATAGIAVAALGAVGVAIFVLGIGETRHLAHAP